MAELTNISLSRGAPSLDIVAVDDLKLLVRASRAWSSTEDQWALKRIAELSQFVQPQQQAGGASAGSSVRRTKTAICSRVTALDAHPLGCGTPPPGTAAQVASATRGWVGRADAGRSLSPLLPALRVGDRHLRRLHRHRRRQRCARAHRVPGDGRGGDRGVDLR